MACAKLEIKHVINQNWNTQQQKPEVKQHNPQNTSRKELYGSINQKKE